MKPFLEDISLWMEALALVSAFFFLKKGNLSLFGPIKILLLGVVLVEIGATFLRINDLPNAVLYNVFIIIWFELFFLTLLKFLESRKFKRVTALFMVGFFLFALWDFASFGVESWVAHRTYIVGSLCLTTSAIFCMVEMVTKPVFINILKEPFFWISVAILAYFIPMSIFMGANEYFKGNSSPFALLYFTTYFRAVKVLNIIHYSLLIFGFYCHFRKQQS